MMQDLKRGRVSGYTQDMPTPRRTKRVNIKVMDDVKSLTMDIAAALTTNKVTWRETDVVEDAIRYYATRKDIVAALAKLPPKPKQEGE